MTTDLSNYYRRDQKDGISPPDLGKTSSFVEHIVHARGKRSSLTSVSLDPSKITDFGPQLYRLKILEVTGDGHELIEHQSLIEGLRKVADSATKAEKAQAIQAQRYAIRRKEGLVRWIFNTSAVERKDLISWAFNQVQKYFSRC
jgi:hypothetical protein